MANAERRRRPAWVKGERQAPPIPLTEPAARHDPRKIRRKSKSRPDMRDGVTRNTMIDPRVDVQADIDAINRGEAIVDRQHATAWINGRLWGYHTDTGTAFPIEGDGFVPMSQIQYFALRKYAEYNGVNERSEWQLANHPDLTDEDREVARRVWRMREQAED